MKITKNYIIRQNTFGSNNNKRVDRITITVLLILWLGAAILTSYMIFRWHDGDANFARPNSTKVLFIDDMLVNTSDLSMDDISSLINITLNSSGGLRNKSQDITIGSQENTKNTRKVIYQKIINQKIKKANGSYSEGFDIRPIPN